MRTTPTGATLAIGLASSPAFAAVQVVSHSGPFTDVQSAVDAASDGDTVLVKTGVYPGFKIDDKAVDVIADVPGVVAFDTPIRVQSLAAARTVLLRGLHVSTDAKESVIVFGCHGSVLVEECELEGGKGDQVYTGPSFHPAGWSAVRVEGSGRVTLTRSS